MAQDSNELDAVIGALFPILPAHTDALFNKNQAIFVKFTKFNKLTTNSLIIFYVSGEKVLIGEGKIKNLVKMKPEKAWIKYGERIFLDKKDYIRYTKISPIENEVRKMKELTVFFFSILKKYEKPLPSAYPVTASGRYITTKMINRIMARQ